MVTVYSKRWLIYSSPQKTRPCCSWSYYVRLRHKIIRWQSEPYNGKLFWKTLSQPRHSAVFALLLIDLQYYSMVIGGYPSVHIHQELLLFKLPFNSFINFIQQIDKTSQRCLLNIIRRNSYCDIQILTFSVIYVVSCSSMTFTIQGLEGLHNLTHENMFATKTHEYKSLIPRGNNLQHQRSKLP